jgi:hypothetical protein
MKYSIAEALLVRIQFSTRTSSFLIAYSLRHAPPRQMFSFSRCIPSLTATRSEAAFSGSISAIKGLSLIVSMVYCFRAVPISVSYPFLQAEGIKM